MNLPLTLYHFKRGKNYRLPIHFNTTDSVLLIKSYKRFCVRIYDDYYTDINGDVHFEDTDTKTLDKPFIYSVKDDGTHLKSDIFSETVNSTWLDFSYSLYLGKTEKQVIIEVYEIPTDDNPDPEFQTYYINYEPNTILESQEHYLDLQTNYNLPSVEELMPAIIKSEKEYDIARRLLLDYKEIKKHTGKLKAIEQYLKFIGFDPDTIKLYPEYLTPDGKRTITHNKQVDKKTGHYHLLFDNFDIQTPRYTRKNLPNIQLEIKDISGLIEKLWYAIALAHKYFTIAEQEISFFGIHNMANSEQFISMVGNNYHIEKADTLYFTKNINIDIFNQTSLPSVKYYVVKNNKQEKKYIKKSEVKTFSEDTTKAQRTNPNIFLVDREFPDGFYSSNLTKEEQLKVEHLFGNVLHIHISAPNTKIQYHIINKDNELIQYTSELIETGGNLLQHTIFVKVFGTYKITVWAYDYYGNRQEYIYDVIMKDANIGFNLFNSSALIEDNKIKLEVDSAQATTGDADPNNNLIISPLSQYTEAELNKYFNNIQTLNTRKQKGDKQQVLKPLNKNYIVDDATNFNTDYIENFLEVYAIKKIAGIHYQFDGLFVKEMEVRNTHTSDDTDVSTYYFIASKENSVNISKYLHTITIVDLNLNKRYNIDTIKTLPTEYDFRRLLLPLNYDITLIQSKNNKPNIGSDIWIKSTMPRLTKINTTEESETLKLGDIVLCTINPDLVINEKDITWELFNSFTGEKIYTSNRYSMLYRLNEKTLYDIHLKLNIDDITYTHIKKNIISSFI